MTTEPTSLLTYKLTSTPNPLKIIEAGSFKINISPPKDSDGLSCKDIKFKLPYGDEPNAIFQDEPKVTLSSGTNWKLVTSQVIKPNLSTLEVTLNNRNPGHIMPNDLTIEISGDINSQTGTINLDVSDDATNDPNKGGVKKTVLKVTKVTNEFFVNNFVSASPNAPGNPKTAFNNKEKIQFSWEGNGTGYSLYQGGIAKPIYQGSETQFTLGDGLTRDTSFVLQATSNATGNTQTLYQSIGITIDNPDLTPKSSDISGAEVIGDGLKVENGKIILKGESLSVNSPANFDHNVTIKGNPRTRTTVEDLISQGILKSNHTEISDYLIVGGPTKLQGGLNISGGHETRLNTTTVALFGDRSVLFTSENIIFPSNGPTGSQSFPIPPKKVTAKTDGLLFISTEVTHTPEGLQPCYAKVTIDDDVYETVASGYGFKADRKENITATQTFTLPIKKGDDFTYSGGIPVYYSDGHSFINGSIKITWFPLGLAAPSESIETDTHHQKVIEDTELLVEEMVIDEGPGHDEKIELLVEAIHNISDSTESRQTMTDLLKDIL